MFLGSVSMMLRLRDVIRVHADEPEGIRRSPFFEMSSHAACRSLCTGSTAALQ